MARRRHRKKNPILPKWPLSTWLFIGAGAAVVGTGAYFILKQSPAGSPNPSGGGTPLPAPTSTPSTSQGPTQAQVNAAMAAIQAINQAVINANKNQPQNQPQGGSVNIPGVNINLTPGGSSTPPQGQGPLCAVGDLQCQIDHPSPQGQAADPNSVAWACNNAYFSGFSADPATKQLVAQWTQKCVDGGGIVPTSDSGIYP